MLGAGIAAPKNHSMGGEKNKQTVSAGDEEERGSTHAHLCLDEFEALDDRVVRVDGDRELGQLRFRDWEGTGGECVSISFSRRRGWGPRLGREPRNNTTIERRQKKEERKQRRCIDVKQNNRELEEVARVPCI